MRYDLVIFDNDGVLVDSERIANRVLAGFLTELGHPTTLEESVRDFMGSSVTRVREVVRARTGDSLPLTFEEVLHERTFAAFRRELLPVDGIDGVLDKLEAEGVPYCVASSGTHERIRVSLTKAGLYERFGEGLIFSAQDVARGKPDPDLFLHAAGTMGVPPGRCAVVEDSPLGLRAGVAAGMDVYGYAAMTPPDRLAAARERFTDMNALVGLLSS
ncbi:HAD family hydrolase [Streptomyces sp. DSM 42041]|uniref:HAD family hydrolase n=1 Tax=Streptomyces hazeniae TaxID=3075538 RepID=A0ABU2NUT6_9ACTN|nr:HAD family hydrolase [Streptomyces sp. DSM 42041]MDT0380741.1 HAD family hydrolase [Streptomyces sp. DSM 42041]